MLRTASTTRLLAVSAPLALTMGLGLSGTLSGSTRAVAPGTSKVTAPASAPATSAPAGQKGRAGASPRSQPRSPRASSPRKPAASRAQGGNTSLGGKAEPEPTLFGHPSESQQKLWFSIADSDSSGWISFREAAATMRFNSAQFGSFDLDKDGRMPFEEFSKYVIAESTRDRAIIEPTLQSIDDSPRRRNPDQLRAAYDTDLDLSISRFELEKILRDHRAQLEELGQKDMFSLLDADDSKALEIDELESLTSYLNPLEVGSKMKQPVLPGASTVLDLFGQVKDMGEAHPPVIAGPVPLFRRLDLNNDGFVDMEDLERLEGRSFNPVRLRSVLNTLDIDHDGRLNKGEFLSSMMPARKR